MLARYCCCRSNSVIAWLPKPFEGSAPARLLRADLLLTGVLFSGDLDARIALNTGPFVNPLCRLDDVADDKLMGIGQ